MHSRPYTTRLHTPTLGWSDSHFFGFSKMGTLLSIGYIFMSLFPKNRQIEQHARQSFHFQKITETLKIYIFKNL